MFDQTKQSSKVQTKWLLLSFSQDLIVVPAITKNIHIIIPHADSNITWLPVDQGHVFACWFYCQTGHYFDCVQPTYLNLCMRALKARPLRQLVVKFFTSTSVYLETDTTAMLIQCSYKTIQN